MKEEMLNPLLFWGRKLKHKIKHNFKKVIGIKQVS